MRQAYLLLALSSLLVGPGAAQAESRGARLERWTEEIELDLFAQVVRDARVIFATDSELARDGEALSLYARALSRSGEREQAYRLLQGARPGPETSASVDLALARLELEDDRLAAVIERLALPDPQRPLRHESRADSWWLLGKARYRSGDSEGALPLLRQFVTRWRLHPQAPAAWHILAQAALAARELERARSCRDQGQNLATWHAFYRARRIQIREKPRDPLARFSLAQLWSSVEELERAGEALDATLELDPNFARAWALRGEIERKRGQPQAAREAYDRALELDGSLGDTRYNRAQLALARQDDEAARADLELIVDGPEGTASRYLGAHLSLARLLQRQGQAEAAHTRHARYIALGGAEEL